MAEIQQWMRDAVQEIIGLKEHPQSSSHRKEFVRQNIETGAAIIAAHAPQPETQGSAAPYRGEFSNYRDIVYTLRKRHDADVWVAHALAYDVVATGSTKEEAVESLRSCLVAQIAFAKGRNCFFPAPPNYWKPPYESMSVPTPDELATCKFEPVESDQPVPEKGK
jgi:hypothetical protein